jgi:HSP20 family protein
MSTLVRWQPFRELASLQSEMSRLLNGTYDGLGAGAQQNVIPPLDVWETADEVIYAFDLPGVTEENVELQVHDDTLTVTARRDRVAEESSDRFYRFERRYGTFARAVGLPQGADEGKITANFENGVLEVRVPKPEQAKPRRISLGDSKDAHADIEGDRVSAA